MSDDLFFGFDLSTQQLKLVITTSTLSVLSTHSIEFDKDLSHYKTKKGVYSSGDEIKAPVLMWIEAVDLILERLVAEGFDFSKVRGISGSCQQHGSVYWSKTHYKLGELTPDKKLCEQIGNDIFSIETSPNWQDHSTGAECKEFEEIIGVNRLSEITGSRAHYRFTGTQIRKIVKNQKELYDKTERISLVSSFLASLFLGKVTGIEESDACGMNLYDIGKRQWNDELLAVASLSHSFDGVSNEDRTKAVNDLKAKLGDVTTTHSSIGTISSYYQTRYGFKDTRIYSFTGDNPATILSLPLAKDDILISLGTSTTVLLITDQYIPSSNYHLFIHPTIPGAYMGMICYCNGSLAREQIRDELDGTWDTFNKLLDKSHGFNNKLGVYFPLSEIVPNASAQTIRGVYQDNKIEPVDSWDVEEDAVSIVESQALSCRARVSPMLSTRNTDLKPGIKSLEFDEKTIEAINLNQRPNKVTFVGGASKNGSIVSKFSSILGSLNGNYTMDNTNACALGGAFKAHWSYINETEKIEYTEFLEKFNWELEPVESQDLWENYIDGVNSLNLLEKLLI